MGGVSSSCIATTGGGGEKIRCLLRSCKKKIRSRITGEIRCETCNIGFYKKSVRRKHYESSGWHEYNRNRKKAGAPPLKQADFLATRSPVLYLCRPCGKGFRTGKAHAQHLESRAHVGVVRPSALNSVMIMMIVAI